MSPGLRLNPERVELDEIDELRVEGSYVMSKFNGIAAWRRRKRFEKAFARNSHGKIIVAEGDSWFQFPFLLDDVVDHLEEAGYLTSCVSAAGDTLANMVVAAPEYLDVLARQEGNVAAFLFSGAGNDIIGADPDGVSVIEKVLRTFSPGKPVAWYLDTPEFVQRIAFIERCYRTVLKNVAEIRPGLRVVIHGYDYSIPGGFAEDPRRPVYAAQDQWLAKPLRRLGINDPDLQRQVIAAMADALHDLLDRLAGEHPNAAYVDLRGTNREVGLWNDEIHPTNKGFKRVTQKLAAAIG
jgi:hypothetical protein